MPPSISLCLIARDEESLIGDCLRSVRDAVDQVIVVDTGSTDDTARIARDLGATVVSHRWVDDFSAARNRAIAEATGTWILVLDADERLAPGAGAKIRRAVAEDTLDCALLPLHDADTLDAPTDDVLSGARRRSPPVLLPRLFRRDADLLWEGVIHEQPTAWLSSPGRRIGQLSADIVHLGNVPSVREARDKGQRNLHLLERRVALHPDDAVAGSYLARERLRAGDPEGALRAANAAWIGLGHQLSGLSTADTRPAIAPVATMVGFLRLPTAGDTVPGVMAQAREWGADHPNIDLLDAAAIAAAPASTDAALRTALARAARCTAADGRTFTTELLPGATTHAAALQAGLLHTRLGDTTQARAALGLAARDRPDNVDVQLALTECALIDGDARAALALVRPLLSVRGGGDAFALAACAAATAGAFESVDALASRAHTMRATHRIQWRERALRVLDARATRQAMGSPLSRSPGSPWERAKIAAAAGHLDGAANALLELLQTDPANDQGWMLLARVLQAAGLPEAREHACTHAAALCANRAVDLRTRARELTDMGARRHAAAVSRRLYARDPRAAAAVRDALELHATRPTTGGAGLTVWLHGDNAPDALATLDALALSWRTPDLQIYMPRSIQPGSHALPISGHADTTTLQDILSQCRSNRLLILRAGAEPDAATLAAHTIASPHPLSGARKLTGHARRTPPGAHQSRHGFSQGGEADHLSVPVPASRAALATCSAHPAVACKQLLEALIVAKLPPLAAQAAPLTLPPLPLQKLREYWRCLGHADRVDTRPIAQGLAETLARRARLEATLPVVARATSIGETLQHDAPMLEADLPVASSRLHQVIELLAPADREAAALGSAPSSDLHSQLTSVIIPNLNGMPHLVGAVESLRAHTTGPVELIIVDNGSTDDSLRWLRAQPDIRLIALPENVGAPAARNHGLAVAGGATILYCDNDVVFTPNWRRLMLNHLEAWPDIGAVGPMSDYVSGVQKVRRDPDPGDVIADWATRFTTDHKGSHSYTHRLILFFVLLRRSVVEQIGGIDEIYGRWGFEDDDLSLRVGRAGWHQRVAGDCFIQHLGSRTSVSAGLDYPALLLENWEIFKRRWGLDPAMPYGTPYDPLSILQHPMTPDADRVALPQIAAPPPVRLLANTSAE